MDWQRAYDRAIQRGDYDRTAELIAIPVADRKSSRDSHSIGGSTMLENRRTPLEDTFAAMLYWFRLADDSAWRVIRRHGIEPGTPVGDAVYAASEALWTAEKAVREYITFDPAGL